MNSVVANIGTHQIRQMRISDLPRVAAVERDIYQFPWGQQVFGDCLRTGYVCRVYYARDELCGYGIMSMAANECHILNLCIKESHQGSGHGRNLLQHLLDIAIQNRNKLVFLEVRISNVRAHALYHDFGFNEIGTRKNYYPAVNGREDAMVLAKMLL